MNLIRVKPTTDFTITGEGDNQNWQKAEWLKMTKIEGSADYATKCKILYSETGIYVLIDCEDNKLNCTFEKDFEHLFVEDVVEVFLQPKQDRALYFEYELSPLNYELPILIPNIDGIFHGWLPWHYDGDRKVKHATSVRGGDCAPGASVSGWTAEMFIPYALLVAIGTPAKKGDVWRGNVYRIDTDESPESKWALEPDVGGNFHNYKKFSELIFE